MDRGGGPHGADGDRSTLQTTHTAKALSLAQAFRESIGRMRVGPAGYVPDMTTPEGPSTAGGVRAMQHVRLTPPEPSMPTLVVGNANQKDGKAELRTFEYVDAVCRQRFGQGAPIERGPYAEFVAKAQSFLEACGMIVKVAEAPADLASFVAAGAGEPPAAAPATSGGATMGLVAIAAIVVVGLVVAAFLVLK